MKPSHKQKEKESGFPSRGLIAGLRDFIAAPVTDASDWKRTVWLGLSFFFAAYFASAALRQAFSGEYVTQDDARQHVFWMYRYVDAGVFPNDLIADYFQSIAPLGYSALYRALIATGLDPLFLGKVLPGFLGLAATGFCFGVCMRILPAPGAAFFSTLILNQSMWMQDDLVSATPRAFAYPLFLGFLYFLMRGSLAGCVVLIALQGLFYPATAFVSAGVLVLRLIRWKYKRFRLSGDRRDYVFCAAGVVVLGLVLLSYMLKTSVYGPVISGSEARQMPEFLPGGRTAFFGFELGRFWITGKRSGMIPDTLLSDIPAYLGLLLPVFALCSKRIPLVERMTAKAYELPRIVLASIVMFFASHLLLFKLHHPNRYTAHTIRIALCISAGLALAILLDAILRWGDSHDSKKRLVSIAATAVLIGGLLWFPNSLDNFPNSKYRTGRVPSLYAFFSSQPDNSLIASLAQEVKNVPIFSRRSILVAREYSLPFHKNYYSRVSERAYDLINAHYTENLRELQDFIKTHGVTFILIERNAFTPEYLSRDTWIKQYQPAANEAIEKLKTGAVPALQKLMNSCAVFENEDYVVVAAECILKTSPE